MLTAFVILALWRPVLSEAVLIILPVAILGYIALFTRRALIRSKWTIIQVVALSVVISGVMNSHSLFVDGRLHGSAILFPALAETLIFAYYISALLTVLAILESVLAKLLRVRAAGDVGGCALAANERQSTAEKNVTGASSGLLRKTGKTILFIFIALPFLAASVNVIRVKRVIPKSYLERNPDFRYLYPKTEEISFSTKDGIVIKGWFVKADSNSGAAVLVCHGLGASRCNLLPIVAMWHTAGINVLVFDFRGHGNSGGRAVSFGAKERFDVVAAREYLKTRADIDTVYAHALSMGAAAVLEAVGNGAEFDGIVLDTPYYEFKAVAGAYAAAIPGGIGQYIYRAGMPISCALTGENLYSFAPGKSASRVKPGTPVVVFRSSEDGTIPPGEALRVFKELPGPKRLVTAEGAGHGQAYAVLGRVYEEAIFALLKESR